MAKIRVDLSSTIVDGQPLTFRSPAACSAVDGLIVYYPQDGQITYKTFLLADAHGNNVGGSNLFASDVIVKVILDVPASRAYIQNADTNKYIEERLKDVASKTHGHFAHEIQMLDRTESAQDVINAIETEIGNMTPVYGMYEPGENDIANVLTQLYLKLYGKGNTIHLWERTKPYNKLSRGIKSICNMETGHYTEVNGQMTQGDYAAPRTFTYSAADSVAFDEEAGTITLVDPYTITFTVTPNRWHYGQSAEISCSSSTARYIEVDGYVGELILPLDYTVMRTRITDGTLGGVSKYTHRGSASVLTYYYATAYNTEIIQSTIENEYTEGQVLDGWTYHLKDTVTLGATLAKVEYGEYLGNGTPPILTFESRPLFVVILPPYETYRSVGSTPSDTPGKYGNYNDAYYLMVNNGDNVNQTLTVSHSELDDVSLSYWFDKNTLTWEPHGSNANAERAATLSFGGGSVSPWYYYSSTYRYFALLGG